MGSINRATLVGRVGGDPEFKTFGNDDKVCEFSLATSQTWRDKNSGERKEKTQWHRIKVQNQNILKIVEQYVKKGMQVGIEGEIQYRQWEKDGTKHYATEIVVGMFDGKLHLLDSKSEGGGNGGGNSGGNGGGNGGGNSGGGQNNQSRNSQQSGNQGGGTDRASRDLDDEIPF